MAKDFGSRLTEARKAKKLTQPQLSDLSGVSLRTIQNYESGTRYPGRMEITNRLAAALDVSTAYLLGEEAKFIEEARAKGGARSAEEVRALVEDVSGCFAGGELPDEDLEAMMQALTEAYFIAKKKNKVFAPKKNSESSAGENE